MNTNLNKRIIIQKKSLTVNEEGYQVEAWVDVISLWAGIKNLHGSEFFQAQAVNSNVTCKMTIRYTKNIDTSMRIVYDNKYYNILYLDDINESHKFIEIMCEVYQ